MCWKKTRFLYEAAVYVSVVLCLSCRHAPLPGAEDLPPGVPRMPGVFEDIGPRWSHDGRRIAFLRRTTDRRVQLCVTSADLTRVVPLLEPDLVSPDRPLHTGRTGFRAPEGVAWSPGDRQIALPRVEWFTFEDGERLPGTGIWVYDLKSGRVAPLAVHPKNYKNVFYYYRSPQWSPDGKRLAFLGEGLHGETALFVRTLAGMDAKGSVPRFDQYEDVGWPAWSPNGKRLAFRQGLLRALTADPVETLRLISPGGLEARRLYLTPRPPSLVRRASAAGKGGPNPQADFMERDVSDAGALTGEESRHETASPFPSEVRAAREGGRGVRCTSLSFSLDGSRLAFARTPDALAPEGCSVWILRVDGDVRPHRVSPEDGSGYLAPVWRDAETLGALRPTAEGWEAVALPLDGGSPRVLCRLPSDDMDWSPDRRRIVCAVPAKGKPAAPTTLRVYEISRK